jgi:superfamily II DNA or RNA helicase/SAM-dependent methyltransferase
MSKIPLSYSRPDLAAQFHPHKNPGISVETISAKYDAEVWWICKKGHEWKEKVSSRARQKTVDCKICKSLACTHPHLARELHPTLNNSLLAEDITAGSHRKVWWLCLKGHEAYEATVKNRAVNESGCPFCAGKKVTKSKSLSTTHPELAKMFHSTKNSNLTTDQITSNSRKPVWWICENGHEWQEEVQTCAMRSKTCKICNSFGYLKPELIEEFNPDNQASPYEISINSSQKFKWKCKLCGHEWTAIVSNRSQGSGCPGCSGAAVTAETSLARRCPEIAKEWDYKSNSKTPGDYTIGSEEEVNWICPNGHQYKESIYNRTSRNRGCFTCKTLAYLCPNLVKEWSSENDLSPYEEYARSGKERIWICQTCHHSWRAKTVDRYYGHGCPFCNSGWTIDNIRRFVSSLLPYLDTLSPAARYVLFQQKGLSGMDKGAKGRSFVQALITGRFPRGELEKFIDEKPSFVDEFLANPKLSLDQQKDDLTNPENCLSENECLSIENDLPTVETKDILSLLDSNLLSNLDHEVVDFFIKEAVARIWQHTFSSESEAILQLQQFDSLGPYPQEVRKLFLADYYGAKDLQIPCDYSFIHQPNLMQRYTAHLVKSRKRLGNWSGTGAGKTLSAILASRVIDANLTVICCPNNVIDNWKNSIVEIFPNSSILIKDCEIISVKNNGKNQYLILNYEFFQKPNAESELKFLLKECLVDFVIIDEIHYSKQREERKPSKRKRTIASFLCEAAVNNENLHVLGMSATPVINNLFEGKTLIELITNIHHDDLQTQATVSNCISLYQKFVCHGLRWVPPYSYRMNLVTEQIDCSSFIPEIMEHFSFGSLVNLEAILIKAKLPFIIKHLKAKTIVYTHFVKDIWYTLQKAFEQAGWRVAIFTGLNKDGLDAFVKGDADILIASSCIGTGVDGLQRVCNRLIVGSLPWTHAEFEQLKGRIYRQGQKYDSVDIFVPLTFADVNGQRWSWCESRWNRLQFKKSISDAAVDGVIPEGHLRTPAQAYKDSMLWLERLERGEINEIERRKISITLTNERKSNVSKKFGDLPQINYQINHELSTETHERFLKNPTEWEHYHTVYRDDRKNWPVVPFQEALNWLIARPHMVIGDFGCGEAFLAKGLKNKVYSFDHIAINQDVIACDMVHVPLDNLSLDAAVFSLSLMGTNFLDYLKEAHRCLKLDGHLWIAEPTSRIKDVDLFKEVLFRFGFDVSRVDEKWKFTFFRAIKSERDTNLNVLENRRSQDILN